MTVAEILQEIVKIGHRYQAKEVVLFGSRAKGTAAERSDIDIAISGCRDFDRCRDEIDNIPTLYSIDVVNTGYLCKRTVNGGYQKIWKKGFIRDMKALNVPWMHLQRQGREI